MEGAGCRVSTEDAFFPFCGCETPPSGGRLRPKALPGRWEPGGALANTSFLYKCAVTLPSAAPGETLTFWPRPQGCWNAPRPRPLVSFCAWAPPLTGSCPQVVFEKGGVYLHTSAKKHQDPDSLIAGVIRVVEKVGWEGTGRGQAQSGTEAASVGVWSGGHGGA